MKKRIFKYGIFINFMTFLFAFCTYSSDLSVLGALTLTQYNLNPTPISSTLGTGFGVGVTGSFDISPFVSLESGVIFLSHSFTFINTTGAGPAAVASNFVQIPFWVKLFPIRSFSFNMGPYYSLPTSASPGSVSPDYGFELGGSVHLDIAPNLQWRIDALFEYGLANLTSAGFATQNSRNFLLLTGLLLDFF